VFQPEAVASQAEEPEGSIAGARLRPSMRRPTVSMLRHFFLHDVSVSIFMLCSRPPPGFHSHSWWSLVEIGALW